MWHEIVYRVLSIINYAVLITIAIPLLLQIFYVLFFFVKKKTFKPSEEKGRIAYLIPAHNEEDVIYDSVKTIFDNQNYPRDKFDVYVVADNCTDKTAEYAKKAGAIVLIHDDPDPAHHMAAYPLKFGINHIVYESGKEYDMVIRVDADNHLHPDYSKYMNDAYMEGVDLARPYEGTLNATQNFYTKACALFYVFESRYGSRVRERLHLAAHVNGSGAMMSVRMLKATGGYDCVSISEDAEYYFNRLMDGYKGHFVEDAVIYEDMPSSFKDTLNRNKRIGSGSVSLLKPKFIKMFGKFFTTGNFSYIEICLSYSFIFLTVLLAVWLPLFYVYNFLYLGFAAYGYIELSMHTAEWYYTIFWNTIIIGGSILLGLFVLFGYLQAFFLVMTDYKKIGAKNRRELLSAVFLFPLFLILYSVTICIGTMSKPTWGRAKRNKSN
ncbi:MAG: glycosyltransferase family 2 protein [Clostridia bacterium]|nr:glycosyltransferase family 2 protein [Clostridia bacterium]